MSNWYILGGGGHASVILDALHQQDLVVKGFYDDNSSRIWLYDVPRLGAISESGQQTGTFVIGIGNNTIRRQIAEQFLQDYRGVQHPKAVIASGVSLGAGTVVMAGAVINIGVEVGIHCIINTASSVDHDCRIGDYVHIGPGATLCGGVSVGENTLVGAGATLIPGVTIGAGARIGAGAVVIRDVPAGATVVGNPAREI